MKKKIVTIVLTFNSEATIKKVILKAKKVSKNVVICDSFSNDSTIKIAKSLYCKIVYKKFTNYAAKRNYIIRKCNRLYDWQLHLDADEILTNNLIKNINRIVHSNDKNYSYLIKRKAHFLNKKLSFGGSSNWHLRLFPSGTTLVEYINYDNHFKSKLKSKKISGILNDLNLKNLTEWVASHNTSSTLSAKDNKNKNSKNIVQPKLFGNTIERLRFFKHIFYLFPSGIRPFLLFIINYFFLLGFLDGKAGFYYCFFHSLWFRTLIDAKKFEKKSIKY